MKKDLLYLKPKQYLCPFCNEWHEWNQEHYIGYYNIHYPAKFLACPSYSNDKCTFRKYSIFLDGNFLYYSVDYSCECISIEYDGKIDVDLISVDLFAIVTFEIQQANGNTIKLGFKFDKAEFNKIYI